MQTLVLERNNRIFLTAPARVVGPSDDVARAYAGYTDWSIDEKTANPFIKWLAGDFVESDKPNQNTQFWTAQDLSLGEYSIKYAPLNMLHKQRVPVGFFLATNQVSFKDTAQAKGYTDFLSKDGTRQDLPPFKIQALSGMWTHIFPFESAVIDQADDQGALFYSMECRGTHVHCAGPDGCDESFDYMTPDVHCEHLKERSSIRHIVNPTFRGGALIVPPTQPGWNNARATVLLEESLREEAVLYAEQTELAFTEAQAEGRNITAHAWESLMALLLTQA